MQGQISHVGRRYDVTQDTLAREIAQLMYAKNIKRVPVLRDGKLIGIVARSDLVRALAEKLDGK
jgi:CBS domain-containing protein